MIRYTLTCPEGHRFDSWFRSAAAFDSLSAAGHVSCAACGSSDVKKTLMAPKVKKPPQDAPATAQQQVLAKPGSDVEKALSALRDKVEREADYVGRDFAREARAIHLGETPERAIYGETDAAEAKALLEDGVPVAPLPFLPKRKTN